MLKRFEPILATILMLSFVLVVSAGQNQQKQQNCKASFSTGESTTVSGEIAAVIFPMAKLKSDGKEYTVHLGPKWYWTQNKLELRSGKAQITGKVAEADGQIHIYPSVIKQGETSITLTDESGQPQWSGTNGKQAGKQHGQSQCGKCKGCCKRQCGGCKAKSE
jgi:hypothetical protein